MSQTPGIHDYHGARNQADEQWSLTARAVAGAHLSGQSICRFPAARAMPLRRGWLRVLTPPWGLARSGQLPGCPGSPCPPGHRQGFQANKIEPSAFAYVKNDRLVQLVDMTCSCCTKLLQAWPAWQTTHAAPCEADAHTMAQDAPQLQAGHCCLSDTCQGTHNKCADTCLW